MIVFFKSIPQVKTEIPLFIAQDVNATFCRGCISKWHGIEKGRALNERAVEFVVGLIMEWIEGQINEKGGSAACEKISKGC